MALLEMTALIDRPQTWAKAMDRSGASTDLKNWLKDAEDMTKLQTAMVSALVARGQDKAGQKRKASALSDDDDDDDDDKKAAARSPQRREGDFEGPALGLAIE